MTYEELNKLEEKVNWSGFDRTKGREVILKLIEEIRRLKNDD